MALSGSLVEGILRDGSKIVLSLDVQTEFLCNIGEKLSPVWVSGPQRQPGPLMKAPAEPCSRLFAQRSMKVSAFMP